jgi:hypothetical protein
MDVDALLNELEERIDARASKAEQDADVDALLNDVYSDAMPAAPIVRAAPSSAAGRVGSAVPSTVRSGLGAASRCNPVYLSSGEAPSLGGRSACDALRCTGCDFAVLAFPSSAWLPATAYLFFRNNMPDRAKLASGYAHAPGSAAYACQCGWLTVEAADCGEAGVQAIRRGGLPLPATAAGWAAAAAAGRIGGTGWTQWACGGHEAQGGDK